MPLAKLPAMTATSTPDAMTRHAQHSRPLFLGAICGAIAPVLLLAGLLMMSSDRVVVPVVLVFLIALPLTLCASVVLGIPLALWLRSKGWLTALPVCAVGLVVGAIAMASFNYQINHFPQMNDQSLAGWIAWNSAKRGIVPGAILGAVSAVAFCIGAGIRLRLPKNI